MKIHFQKIASPFFLFVLVIFQIGLSSCQSVTQGSLLKDIEEIANSAYEDSGLSTSPVRQKQESSNSFAGLMSPQSYSTIGFILFIISVVYIGVIVICIIRKLFKSRSNQRVDEQAALLVQEERPIERQQNVESVNDGNRYVAINDPEADAGRNQERNH